jgi:hypothetical protein
MRAKGGEGQKIKTLGLPTDPFFCAYSAAILIAAFRWFFVDWFQKNQNSMITLSQFITFVQGILKRVQLCCFAVSLLLYRNKNKN